MIRIPRVTGLVATVTGGAMDGHGLLGHAILGHAVTRARWAVGRAMATLRPAALGVILVVGAGPLAGCGSGRKEVTAQSANGQPAKDPATAATPPAPATPAVMPQGVRDQLLTGAIDVLGRLDDYDEGAAAAQVFDRLNQWSHAVGLPSNEAGWRTDAILSTLPDALADAPLLKSLSSGAFDGAVDVPTLRDQRWLADIAANARRDALDDLEVARNLFDWTIRSLAPSADPPAVPTADNPGSRWFLPGEILLAGRGSAPQRAWMFLELLRHAGLDGVMLAIGDGGAAGSRPWIPALISGGEAYLFEPGYGMPVPGPNGVGIATARQAAADPHILAGLSLPDRPYPVQAGDMGRLTVLVPAAPWNLARRMQRIDAELVGTRRLALAIDPAALGRAAAAALPGGASTDGANPRPARLWTFPWESVVRRRSGGPAVEAALAKELAVMGLGMTQPGAPGSADRVVRPLYVARLREFRGELDGPDGAKRAYLLARPSSAAIKGGLVGAAAPQADAMARLYGQLKENATYFLGVLTLAERDYETAVDYLGRMTLDEHPDGVWADAARINLATARRGLGEDAEAIALLRADVSPQRYGSRLLAERIERERADPPPGRGADGVEGTVPVGNGPRADDRRGDAAVP